MTATELASYFDHTLLKAQASELDIAHLCREAAQWGFASVCVNSFWVPFCRGCLDKEAVRVCAVVGFPLGASSSAVKAFEAREAVRSGAGEVDMVMNVGALKSGRFRTVVSDIREVVEAAAPSLVKVILEICYLSDEEIVEACEAALEAGAHFVKTSTGFGPGGAIPERVALMKRTVGERLRVKASGGIRSLSETLACIEAGADRIGASACVAIMNEFLGKAGQGAAPAGY